MSGRQTATSSSVRSATQRSMHRQVSRLDLPAAVRQSVDGLFRFTHRASDAKALWSETGDVWLGRNTYLHWALDDVNIDIPWVISSIADAPQSAAELRDAVKSELAEYWKDRLSALPRKSTGNWLPLP